MSIPTWPTTLPSRTLLDQYTEAKASNLLVSKVDSGVPKVRRKGANSPDTLVDGRLYTSDQLDILEEFVTDTLENGSLIFYYTHPRKKSNILVRLLPADDNALYKVRPKGEKFTVTLKLMVFP